MPELPLAVQRVVSALAERGVEVRVLVSPTSTRTAAEAAASLGTAIGQIVKSLVFLVDDRPVLALVSGQNRLDEQKLAACVGGHTVTRASAEAVRSLTSFAIGGVPPISLGSEMSVVCDADLLRYPVVYAAAGTPHHNFGIDPHRLIAVTGARVADLKAVAETRSSEA